MIAEYFPARFLGVAPRFVAFGAAVLLSVVDGVTAQPTEFAPGISYANDVVAKVPWSIHYIRFDRTRPEFEVQSTHSMNAAIGMEKLSDQIRRAKRDWGEPMAGVNGDFYERGGSYSGDPRGLQIVDGEMISAPTPGSSATFWVDASGQPHAAKLESCFSITWPNGTNSSFGLNESRGTNFTPVLYTPGMGASTLTRRNTNSVELVLEKAGDGPWLPLKAGETFQARVREVRLTGDTSIARETMVLSLHPAFARTVPELKAGAVLKISTTILPDVRGARTAISAGPVLVHEGKKQDWSKAPPAAGRMAMYSIRSMSERHPRSAVGWNDHYFFLFEVDGRVPNSAGMTLDEMATYMMKLGCSEVMNLDGGGSATLWANGRVVNTPCDPEGERQIANGLIVFRKKPTTSAAQTKQSL